MSISLLKFARGILSLLVILTLVRVPSAAAAVAGDIIPNLTLPVRSSPSVFHLHDNVGQIVVLEFFYHWCPHCRAGTPRVHEDIEAYYLNRGGNNQGIPVKVVYVNLTPEEEEQAAVNEFISTNGLTGVLNDYSFVSFYGVGPTAGAGTPRIAVISGVPNSGSHETWELVHTADGFNEVTTINSLRAAIDSVQPEGSLPPENQLVLTTAGNGTVNPNLNGQLLTLGKKYTVTAVPDAGSLFGGWTGTTSAVPAKLSFVMQPNMALQANFFVNPFGPVKGSYNGLFFPEDEKTIDTSGFITLTLTDRGTFSGKITLVGKILSFSGQFNQDGDATLVLARKGTTSLTVQLHVDFFGSDQITGTVTDGVWTSGLTADRGVFSATNPASAHSGNYTAIIIRSGGGVHSRGVGHGCFTVNIGTDGLVNLSGTLGDGVAIRQRLPLAKDGRWPLFAATAKGRGLILGWVVLEDTQFDDFYGPATWIRWTQPGSKLYAGGFTNDTEIIGSRFVAPPAGTRVINLTDGVVAVSGGNLIVPHVNQVTLGADNKVTNLSTNKLTLSIKAATGLFSGSMQTIGIPTQIKFKGVVLQKQDAGWGYFPGIFESGTLYFGPPF